MKTELEAELPTYGIDPKAERLTGASYEAAMSELVRRREAALSSAAPSQRERSMYLRSTLQWHLYRVRPSPHSRRPPPCTRLCARARVCVRGCTRKAGGRKLQGEGLWNEGGGGDRKGEGKEERRRDKTRCGTSFQGFIDGTRRNVVTVNVSKP